MKQLPETFFTHNGFRLHYADQGSGVPVLLIHGFGSTMQINWFDTGWVDFLLERTRRVIALDLRGHGRSDKPHDPALYEPAKLAEDAVALLDHLNIGRADIMGYSMGARISAFMLINSPERICSAVLAGTGPNLNRGISGQQDIIDGLLAPSLQDVTTEKGRMFRKFAEQTKSDLKALAACMSAERRNVIKNELATINVPVLIATGTRDEVAGNPRELAQLIPGSKVLDIEGRDHMRAVGDRQYKDGVASFWSSLPPCKG